MFLIGSWDELPEVADKIRKEFRSYCADNEHFTLSAGIAVVGGRYPISRAAELAGEAEHAAKSLTRGKKEKNALCFLDTPIGWEDFGRAESMRIKICDIMQQTQSRGILGRLRSVLEAVDEFKRLSQKKQLNQQEIEGLIHWHKWRWRLVYNIQRMVKRHNNLKPQLDELVALIIDPNAQAGQPVLDWLQMPTRWAEFLTRQRNN